MLAKFLTPLAAERDGRGMAVEREGLLRANLNALTPATDCRHNSFPMQAPNRRA